MKIIHCSDLHLDSPMNTHLTSVQARERNAEICHNFGRLVDYAMEEQVQAVLIAGDLFDGRRVTARTGNYVLEQIRRAKQIPFFYIRGNHDESTQGFQGEILPSNLKTFGPEWRQWRLSEKFGQDYDLFPAPNEYPDVVIAGIEPENWESDFYSRLHLSEDSLNIVMMHGQVSSHPGKDLISLPDLTGKLISYLALGHLHSYQQATLEAGSSYCYSGCLEGRGWDECGPKGFVLIETSPQGLHSRFVPWASRVLHEVEVDITEMTTITQLRQGLMDACQDISGEDLVRFNLTGSYTLETQKDLDFLKKGLEDIFYHVEIVDHSSLAIETKDYDYDISLKGAFIRSVMKGNYTQEETEAILQYGLAALQGEVLP